MSKKMPKIDYDYFKMKRIICEIDDEECDGFGEDCSKCLKAIVYLTYDEEDEFNDMIKGLIPSNSRLTKNGKGLINQENTIVRFESIEAMETDGLFQKYEFTGIKHGYPLHTPIHYPRFYLLKQTLKLGVPDYYLFQDFKSPMVAVYPNAVYGTAPEYPDDE